jgi:DNA-binding transcriptional LysR family regulator
LDPRQLRHVLALARHGSFSKAATALGVTQPALSKSIGALERDLGCRLFDRSARGVALTPAGRALAERAEPLLVAMDDLREQLEPALRTSRETVWLGSTSFGAGSELCAALRRLMAERRGLNASVVVGRWQELAHSLHVGRLDLVIGECRYAEADPELAATPLHEQHPVWFVRPGHPLLGRADLRTRDVFEFCLAVPGLPPAHLAWMEKRRARAATPTSLLQCDHLELLMAVVASGDAVGISTRERVADEVARGLLVELPLPQPGPGPHLGVITVRERALGPAAVRLREILCEGREAAKASQPSA